jgi:hypothetical protein
LGVCKKILTSGVLVGCPRSVNPWHFANHLQLSHCLAVTVWRSRPSAKL